MHLKRWKPLAAIALFAVMAQLAWGAEGTKKPAKGSTAAPVAAPAPAAPIAAPSPAPAVLKLSVGQPVKLDGFEVVLNKVVQPGAEALGGMAFTEYTLAVTNTSPDKDLLISNATLLVAGEVRQVVRDLDDIVLQEGMATKTTAVNAGAMATGFIGGLLGPIGAIGSMMGVNAVASKVFVDDPQKWREELKKRGFPGVNEAGVPVFPTESTTGSLWFKQAGLEVADRLQLYVKQGGSSRVVRLDLVGMPAAVAKSE